VVESWSHGVVVRKKRRSQPLDEISSDSATPELLQLLNSFFKGIHQNSGENRVEPDLV
jgi:hypothetical protein